MEGNCCRDVLCERRVYAQLKNKTKLTSEGKEERGQTLLMKGQ